MSVALLTALAGYARALTPEEALARVNTTDAPARVASMTRDGGISLCRDECRYQVIHRLRKRQP